MDTCHRHGQNRAGEQWGNERGATLVWAVLALLVLLAMLALVLDGSYAYGQRRRMQNAADAAALAGARILGLNGNDTQVGIAVDQYALSNGADEVSWSILNGRTTVRVTAACTFTTFFAGIIGRPQMTASGLGEASLEYLSRADNLLPMAIEDRPWVFEQIYELWNDDLTQPGNFGWLDWDGVSPNAAELADNIANPGNSGEWGVGDWVPGCPGENVSGNVRSAVGGWVGHHVTVIIYDTLQQTGQNTSYRIAGFAEFFMHGYDLTGGDKRVWGHFVRWVEPGQGGGPNHGVSSVRLTQ